MNNSLKIVFSFILGGIVTGSVVYAVSSQSIGFTPTDNTWEVETVEDALNDLYTRSQALSKPELIWTNPAPTAAFAAQTIELDLSEYDYLIIIPKLTNSSNIVPQTSVLVKIPSGTEGYSMSSTGTTAWVRKFFVSTTGITFNKATTGSSNNTTNIIPYKIYGIKGEIDIDID